MKNKVIFFKKIAAIFVCAAMLIGNFSIDINKQEIFLSNNTLASAADLDTSAKEEIQDGAILQAFCWSFNTIKANMADIAAAGYTAVQTSPIQACIDTNFTMELTGDGHWYYHYQPIDFTIGNYQVGTEAEFKAMCDEADAYGIKVIVDVVPNHTTTTQAKVSQNLIDAVGGLDKLYHAGTGLTNSSNYSNVLESTRYAIGNLPDIDTENAAYQNYFISFLNQCIADGADGFRYDSAKHIGLPEDVRPEGVVNNFWEKVTTEITNAEGIFNYGEVLQGTNDRLAGYVDAIGATTASAYGAGIRTALNQNKFLVSDISDYKVDAGVDTDNLVTWVESHDNYYNDGTGSVFDNTDIVLGWAIISARASGTPLFFSRPEGSSLSNPYGTNTIGIAGDDNYKNDQVAAVNKFRTAMVGQSENLTNPDGNAQVLMIERGTEGVVIVNGSSGDYPVDTDTSLSDGTYINRTADDSVFTVINGKISGVLPARSAVVLYGAEAANSTTMHFYNADKWGTVNTDYAGASLTNDLDGWWTVTVPADVIDGFTISFHDGGVNHTETITVNNGAALYYAENTAYATKADAEAALGIVRTTVWFFNSGSWSDVSGYAYIDGSGDKLFGDWPGKAAKSEGDGWWSVDIPSVPADNLHIIFNDSGNGRESKNFVISNPSNVYLTNENENKYTSKLEALTAIEMVPGTTVAYFYNNKGWDGVYAYTWGAVNLGSWPGTAATDAGDGWWKIVLNADPSMDLNLIFNNNKGSQTANLLVSDVTNRYFSAFNNKAYPSKAALLAANGVSNEEVKIYFYNYKGWDKVYASAGKDGVLLGTFPGILAVEGQNNWWSATIPSEVTNNLKVTFNDGTIDNQSDVLTVNDRSKVYFTGANANAYSSKTAAEADINVEPTKTTVYFYNNKGWAAVAAYLYGDSTAYGNWPGAACIPVGNGWWKTDIPAEASSNLHIIFNNGGNGDQSSDFIISDTINTYVTNFNDKKYTSIEAAEIDNNVVRNLVSVVTPSAITGLVNGTPKTAEALGLPSNVTLITDAGNVTAGVTWNAAASSYVSSGTSAQTFAVSGVITLPAGIVNPENVSLAIQISVSVNAAVTQGTNPVIVTPAPSNTEPAKKELEVTLGNNGTLPIDSILKELADFSNSEVKVSIPFNKIGSTGILLTSEVLAAAKAANKNFSVTVKDKENKELYTWSFDKDALSSLNKDIAEIDLTLDVKALSAEEKLNSLLKASGVVLSFAYDGILPTQVSVRAYVGNINGVKAGSEIYLYHYNHEAGKLEELPYGSDYTVDADGYISVNILHCSDYVALTQKAPANLITGTINQIKVSPLKQTLYTGASAQASTKINIQLPSTLELVNSLNDKTTHSAVGAVTVSYSSSDKKVATVLGSGKIKAAGEGKTTVTTKITLYTGETKTIKTVITVKKPSIKLVKSTASMTVGSEFTFTVAAYGLNTADILWTTSKKSIVVINKKTGVATAKSKGTDYVIAKIGNRMVKIKVVVK